MCSRATSSLLGGILLFMILSSGIAILLQETRLSKESAERDVKTTYYSLRHNILEESLKIKQSGEGGVLEGIDYNEITRVLIIYDNGTVLVETPEEVIEEDTIGIRIRPLYMNEILYSNAIIVLDLGDKGSLTIKPDNIIDNDVLAGNQLASEKAFAVSAILSYTQDLLGPEEAYRVFFIENNGIQDALVRKDSLPLQVIVNVSNIRLVIEKTSAGCPPGTYRITSWGAEADYTILYWLNNQLVKNDTGHLRYTTTSRIGPYEPMYYTSIPYTVLETNNNSLEKTMSSIYTYIKFYIKAPNPFYCTNTWTVYSPYVTLGGYIDLKIEYSGDKIPILIADINDLYLWEDNSTLTLLGDYILKDNIVFYYNNTVILWFRNYVSKQTYYTANIEASNPSLTYLFGNLS